MLKIKRTYIILWVILFILSVVLVATLPSIWIYYNGFNGVSLKDLGFSNEVVESLTKGISIAENILPKNLGIVNAAKLALSYMTAYVPKDFPANNLPVKFWGSIVFVVIVFIENLYIVLSTLKRIKTSDDALFNIPIISQSIVFMVGSVSIALVIVINDKIYYVAAIALYGVVLALSVIVFFGLDALSAHIKGIDDENSVRTSFVKDMIKNFDVLIVSSSNPNSVDALRKVKEELKYSISPSNEKTKEVENKIEIIYVNMKQEVDNDENADITVYAEKVTKLIKERNIICK
jgi:hypothetical protein